MAKVIFEFDPREDREALKQAQMAGGMYSVLVSFDEWLRVKIKHGGKDDWRGVRDELHALMIDDGVDLFD